MLAMLGAQACAGWKGRWGLGLAGMAAIASSACSPRNGAVTPAPEFAYTLLDGTPAHSRALIGQVVLVNFWATTCGICVQEMPQLVSTYQRFAARGFQTLAVAVQYDPPARVADFAQSRQLPFGVVIDNTGAIAKGFGNVRGTPTTFVIDRHGRLVTRVEGQPNFDILHALIEQLLTQT